MDTTSSLLRSAKQFFAGTLFSRLSGLFRDIAMAFCFGVTPELAAFMVAYRLANLLRRLFGEGNLQAGFAPHFETLKKENPKNAFLFYRDTSFSLFALLTVLVLATLLFLSSLTLTPSWQQIIHLTMLMTPALPFICLSSLNAAFLQCQKRYFAPAFAPVLFNLVWILFAFPQSIHILSLGVVLAFAAQWSLTAIQARKELKGHLTLAEWFTPHFFSLDLKAIALPMALGIFGAGAMQINSALDAIFARLADLSGPTYLWYAIRVQQLPLALFGIALSGALLPPLARASAAGDLAHHRTLLSGALRQTTSLIIPCTFALFALGASGLNLLYGRGHFSSPDIQETLQCLWAYGLGLIPASFTLLLAAGCFSKKSYGLPTLASLLSVALNIALNALFVFGLGLGAVSVALATSISAFLNCALLLRKQDLEPGFWPFVAKVSLASSIAALSSLFIGEWLGDGTLAFCRGELIAFSRSPLDQVVQFASAGLIFLGSFLAMAKALRLHEVFMLLQRSAKES
jgi:putative peptidoglycan lipid II flippase